jgi:hypothetical protein
MGFLRLRLASAAEGLRLDKNLLHVEISAAHCTFYVLHSGCDIHRWEVQSKLNVDGQDHTMRAKVHAQGLADPVNALILLGDRANSLEYVVVGALAK